MHNTPIASIHSHNQQPVTKELSQPSSGQQSGTEPATREHLEIPSPIIAEDPHLLKLWKEANEDERFLGDALCQLGARMQSGGIENYFLFADIWYSRYPKDDVKRYKRGLNSVQKGAEIGSYKKSLVYAILKTINVYSREDYAELAAIAEPKGIVITWTHLRMIAERLGGNEYRNVRHEVEKRLVSRKLKEIELKRIIDELAPETASALEVEDNTKPAKKQMSTLIASLKRNSNQFQNWRKTITQYEKELCSNKKDAKKVCEQVEQALQEFDAVMSFVNDSRPILEMLRRRILLVDRHIKKNRWQEPAHYQQPSGRFKFAGEFADDDDDLEYEEEEGWEDMSDDDDPVFIETSNLFR